MGRIPPSFFWRMISLPPNMISRMVVDSLPDNSTFVKAVRASSSFPSGALAIMSSRCCVVRPSGPPDEPAGKVFRVFCTSSASTWNASNLVFPVGSHGILWSGEASGCFFYSSSNVLAVVGAGLVVDELRRIYYQLQSYWWWLWLAVSLLHFDVSVLHFIFNCSGWWIALPRRHSLVYYAVEISCLATSLWFARMVLPNKKRSFQDSLLFSVVTMFFRSVVNNWVQLAWAALGTRVIRPTYFG